MRDYPNTPRGHGLALLDAVLTRRQSLDEALGAVSGRAELARRDRAMARLLVTTVLRRLGQIDLAIDAKLAKSPPKKRHTRNILRQALAELLFLGTPAYAAVNGAVELAKALGEDRYSGLINGILRSVDREGRQVPGAEDAARLNTPDWLWEGWASIYGEATALDIATAHLTEPPLDLTLFDHSSGDEPDSWATKLSATLVPTGSLRLTRPGLVPELPGYKEGAWWVQDAAAALPVQLLGNVAEHRVLDLCAAPGGKTAQLAARGAKVTAVDRSAQRLNRLRDNLTRLELTAEIIESDVASFRASQPFDAILLDAPCSATGTIRRHPDIARLKSPRDIEKAVQVQQEMLPIAIEQLAPGGILVYAVCSLEKREGPDQIDALIAAGAPVVIDPLGPYEIPGLADFVTAEGAIRTLPCHFAELGGMDGFYAVRLRKNEKS